MNDKPPFIYTGEYARETPRPPSSSAQVYLAALITIVIAVAIAFAVSYAHKKGTANDACNAQWKAYGDSIGQHMDNYLSPIDTAPDCSFQ